MFKAALLILVLTIIGLQINFQTSDGKLVKKVLAAETEYHSTVTELQKQIDYWQQVVIDHPDYRDGYLLLALLSTEIGNKDAGQSWLKRVYLSDPNYVLDPKLTTQLFQSSRQ